MYRLQKLQNRTAHIVISSSYNAPRVPQLRSLGWETIDDFINQELRTITCKSGNNLDLEALILVCRC